MKGSQKRTLRMIGSVDNVICNESVGVRLYLFAFRLHVPFSFHILDIPAENKGVKFFCILSRVNGA